MSTKPDNRPDSRQRLLAATCELLWLNSYGSVSVDDLCRRAEVNKGSFYHHFTSKAELAKAAFEAYWEQTRPALDGIFSAQVPPLERFDRYAAATREIQRKKQAQHGCVLGCPYTSIGAEVSSQDTGLREIAALKVERTCRYFVSAIRDAQSAGLIPAGDAESLAYECQAYATGIASQARITDSLVPFDRLADGFRRLLGAAIPVVV